MSEAAVPAAAPVVPSRARAVVLGGGVIGCSVAYHLAEAGFGEVLLLERDRLTSGTTWHAAGLMATFGSTSETSTRLRQYTRELYQRLEAETGQSTGLRQVGLVELATDADRLEEYRRVAAFNRYCGVDVHEIGPTRSRSSSRPRASTTCSPASTSPHDGPRQPRRRDDGARQGRAAARRDDRRGRAGARRAHRAGGGRRGAGRADAARRRRGRGRRQLHRHVGAAARRGATASRCRCRRPSTTT